MFNGRVAGLLSRDEATPERIGSLMTGVEESRDAERTEQSLAARSPDATERGGRA